MPAEKNSGILLYHRFSFDLPLTQSNVNNEQCYRCQDCGMWTADVVFWSQRVCLKRDRRRLQRRRMSDRRSRQFDDTMLIYACALLEIPVSKELTGSVISDFT